MATRERRRKKGTLDMSESVPVKKHYFRRFFYAFSVCFIVFGIIGIVWFVYTQDPTAFGASEKYLQRGEEALAQSDLKTALEYFEKCLEEDPKESEARLHAVDIYRAQGNYRMAERLINDGLSLQPRYEEYYRQMVYLLIEQNRVAEALDYLDGISATYIVVKLNEDRPEDITADPMPGVFSQATDVVLKVPENATVYYTTDGSAPDRNSSVYTPGTPIRVEKGTMNLRAVAITEAGMPGEAFDVSYRVYNENTEYLFKDAKIEKLVRRILSRQEGTIYYKDLVSVTTIDSSSGNIKGAIQVLDDLLEMPNLTTLRLDGETEITSLDPLRHLAQLRTLSMNNCGLTDAHLSAISKVLWLTSLSVANNEITSLSPIVTMVSLQTLNASKNRIETVPSLASLSVLKDLNLSENMIASLSWISGHQTVSVLNLSKNRITDISELSYCASLSDLNLASNQVTSLAALTLRRLTALDISGNPITALDELQGLTGLTTLSVAHTKVETLAPLTKLPGIVSLNVSGTKATDFEKLAGSALKKLYASGCGITSAQSLRSFNYLEVLDLSSNSLSNIQDLIWLQELRTLDIGKNYGISDFTPLLNCSKLTSVSSSGNRIPDDVLSKLTSKGVSVKQ